MGGRVYQPNQPGAKYVNSEETIVYNKRQLLYGLNKAKRGIKQFGYALLVEGYMDVIMAHQFGYTHAVASMGTALTAEQAQKIKRFTDIVYLAMDSDDAGQNAMERSYEVLSQYGITTYVVYLDSKDPADVLRDQGVDAFQALLENAVPIIQFQFDRAMARYDVSKIENVAKVIDEIIPLLKLEKESVIQRHYVQEFCKKLNVDEELVLAKLSNNSYNLPKKKFHFDKNKKSKIHIAEEYLIAISANSLDSRQYVQTSVNASDFSVQHHRDIFSFLLGTQLEGNALLETIQDGSMKSLLCQLLVESNDLLVSKNAQFVDDCIKVVSSQKTAQRILEIKEKIKQLEEVGDHEQLGGLLVELQQLSKKG
jgi:DNA primase